MNKLTYCFIASLAALSAQGAQVQVNTDKTWQDTFPEASTTSDQLWVNSGATLNVAFDGIQQLGAVELGYPTGNTESGIASIVNFTSGTLEVGDLVVGNTLGGTAEALSPKSFLNVYSGAQIAWTGVNDYNGNKRFETSRQSYADSEINLDGGSLFINGATGFMMATGSGSMSTLNILNGGFYKVAEGITSAFTLANGQNSTAKVLISGTDASGNASTLELAGIMYVGGNTNGANATLTIEDGGKLVSGSTADVINIGNYNDNVATVYVNKGGIIESSGTKGLNITLGSGANSTSKLIMDGGEIVKTSKGDKNITIGNNTSESATSLFQMNNNSKISQTENNWQINVKNGTMEVLSGSDIYINGNFTVGNTTSNASKFIIDGSGTEIRGSSGGTSYAGSLYLANSANNKGETIVSGGASAIFRNIIVADKANSQGTLVVKGLGTSVTVGNLAYDTHFGANQSDAANYAGSSAKLEIWTGANFRSASGTGNGLKIYDSAQVSFVMDSSTVLDASNSGEAMLDYFRLDAYKSEGATKPFVIDGSMLKPTQEESSYEVILMHVSEGFYLNDTLLDFDSMSSEEIFSFVQETFDFQNCTDIYGWDDISAENVYYALDRFVLQLTSYAVPEPSTYALIFGAIALALACRRKFGRN